MDNAYTPHNAHDNSYKLLFSHPEMVSDLLIGYIKQPWIEQLDLSTLETVNTSFVSDDLREREDDVIWRVRWQNEDVSQWLYIYLLLEFQSSVDRFMPLRLNIYSHCCPVKYKPVPLTTERGLLEVMNTQLNQGGEDLSVIVYS